MAQQSVTLSGYVKVAESGESLIGATVAAPQLGLGTYTNAYGFYTLNLPLLTDSIRVQYRYVGFEKKDTLLLLSRDTKLNIELRSSELTLEEVEIVANSYAEQVNSTEMSVSRISMGEAKMLPALFGEVDIIKSLQLKPGVSAGSEGSSGIFVRGGGPDQNLVLLDGSTVYNPSHLFGFFSTFNSDAVKDVKLHKGGFPAEYGGRLSSVIDVKMNEGNKKKFAATGGLGLIASRLTLEGPLKKDKASFMLSGRRTYVDIFTRLINKANEDNPDFDLIPDYFFYDLNAKTNYELGENDQLFLSGYLGRDQFNFDDGQFNFQFFWGNSNVNFRWNHIFGPRMFMNTTTSFSDYRYEIANRFDVFSFRLGSQIRDYSLRADVAYLPNNRHSIRFGAQGIYHRFIVGRLQGGAADDTTFSFSGGSTFYASELGAYLSDDIELNKRTRVHLGLRWSGFNHKNTFYQGLEPRFSIRYSLGENMSLKASYARMQQYLHLVSSSGAALPTDVWYPSTAGVRPQRSDQLAAGLNLMLGKSFLLSNEVYYKWLKRQIDFKDGANLFVNNELETEFVFGDGWSYGNELYLEKKDGRLRGWLGYTLSWSWRRFDAISEGRKFPPRNDKRHDISLVLMYDLNARLSLSMAWEYRSGNAISLPKGRFVMLGPEGGVPVVVPIFTERNGFRMPPYHKMDVGLVWKFFPKWGKSDLTFSVYNAYNRRNPYFIFFETKTDENEVPIAFQARQVALFPAIPSITYNFRF
ncbi:MAG: TonB-dependent receptor [Bacteroidetes bacterium]|nr:MAG: TonB-dependent receptor [Bacteroidota bacterium]